MEKSLLKSMFNTSKEPLIDFSLPEISIKAQALVGKLSISGVQPKLSVKFDKKTGTLIPASEGGEYILKPQPQAFIHLPENEQCCMDIAATLGIPTPEHCLLRLKDGSFAYIIKRFDLLNGEKIHQEDFSQILEKDKYDGSGEQIGKKLKEISSAPGLDVQLLFERVVLNFLVGNGDAHLKNYSVNYDKGVPVRLSPAYDIVCSKLVIPDEEDSALAINGRKNQLTRKDFEAFADYLKIPSKVRYSRFLGKDSLIKDLIRRSSLNLQEQEQFLRIVQNRYERLFQ